MNSTNESFYGLKITKGIANYETYKMNCDEEIRLIVYRRKDVFDDLQISLETVAKHQNNVEEKDAEETMVAVKFNRRGCDAYLASACITEMKASSTFRRSVLKRLSSLFDHDQSFIGNKVVFLKLLTPKHQFLDIKWWAHFANLFNVFMFTNSIQKLKLCFFQEQYHKLHDYWAHEFNVCHFLVVNIGRCFFCFRRFL